MLLYDRVLEHAARMRRQTGSSFGIQNLNNLRALRQAAVYELSSVAPLLTDWETGRNQPIPKRPPHRRVWAEWDYVDSGPDGTDWWKLGALIGESTQQYCATMVLGTDVSEETKTFFTDPSREYYCVQAFNYLEKYERSADFPGNAGGFLKQVCCDFGTFMWSMKSDGTAIRRVKIMPKLDVLESEEDVALRATLFWLPICQSVPVGYEKNWVMADPWPPFMAFALLHCKNVVAETVSPSTEEQRHVARAGNPPRTSYKVLKIEVPQTAASHRPLRVTEGDDNPKVRFHLCSGHFKNLQHDRFKSKGWHWWPAHWRGSRALGRVEKSYELTVNAEAPLPKS